MGRLSLAALTLAALAVAQAPTFRSEVKLVRLLVSVKDAKGTLVNDALRDEFAVYDNGVKQDIAVFERDTEQPLSVAIMIDVSGSTWTEFGNEEKDVLRFMRAVIADGNPKDAAALYAFNEDVTIMSSFTRNITRLEHGLNELRTGGATSLYDAVWLVSRDLGGREGRHIIAVISDGVDIGSTRDFHAAVEAAQLADATIYPVVIVPFKGDVLRRIGGEHALTTMAERTGGRTFIPTSGPELDQAFSDLIRELRTQYLVGYYPKNIPPTPNRFHTTTVRLARPGLRAITRSGYYGTTDR